MSKVHLTAGYRQEIREIAAECVHGRLKKEQAAAEVEDITPKNLTHDEFQALVTATATRLEDTIASSGRAGDWADVEIAHAAAGIAEELRNPTKAGRAPKTSSQVQRALDGFATMERKLSMLQRLMSWKR
jgi:hypothetical protein